MYKVTRDKYGNIKAWKCPKCRKMTKDFPALSRRDNETDICSACGIREAMEDFADAEGF